METNFSFQFPSGVIENQDDSVDKFEVQSQSAGNAPPNIPNDTQESSGIFDGDSLGWILNITILLIQ